MDVYWNLQNKTQCNDEVQKLSAGTWNIAYIKPASLANWIVIVIIIVVIIIKQIHDKCWSREKPIVSKGIS